MHDACGAGDVGCGACDSVVTEDWTPTLVEAEQKASSLRPEMANCKELQAVSTLVEGIPGIIQKGGKLIEESLMKTLTQLLVANKQLLTTLTSTGL